MSLELQQERRVEQLCSLGLKYDGEYFLGNCHNTSDINIHWTEILCDDEKQWIDKFNKIQQRVSSVL